MLFSALSLTPVSTYLGVSDPCGESNSGVVAEIGDFMNEL